MLGKIRRMCPLCWQDSVILVVTMAVVLDLGLLLQPVGADDCHAALLFVTGVLVVARSTNGYFYGMTASLIAAVVVNYAFMEPYYRFELRGAGYPFTFVTLFSVSIVTSALTTHIKEQEEAQIEAERERLRANLLRAVSHDIRTPLSSILGATSTLLESQDLDETARRDLLLEVHKDAQWLVRVTENILSVTKFSADGVKLKLTEEVVEEIVGSAITKFRKTGGSISIQVHKPQDILLVPMEATLIEQVLLNLLENVVFHGKCATRIDIDIAEEPSRVCFHVSDNGAGIAEGVLPHLFDGSYAAQDGTARDDSRNMGIGLSVCAAIVAAHGGGMSARNNPSGGATLSFWLPKRGGTEPS